MTLADRDVFEFAAGVTLLGGAPRGAEDLRAALAHAPHLVCADGGANDVGDLTPEAVIGDLDSLADIALWRERLGPALVRVEEQESTDLEKCLRLVRAPFFLGVGFVAGRVDHLLAALHALIAEPRPIALIGETDILFSAGETLSLELAPGDRVSFFPLRPVRATGGAGLTWPIEGLELEAGSQIGVSNRAAAAQVEARFDRPGVVVAAPRARLSSVVQCLV